MDQSSGGEYAQTPEDEGVDNHWFKAYSHANHMWPNAPMPAISVMLTRAVLEQPPKSGEAFLLSRLSDKQVQRLGRYMSRAHADAGVPYLTEEFNPPEEGHVIDDDGVQELWLAAKGYVADLILSYRNKAPYERPEESYTQEDLNKVLDFFDNPDAEGQRELLLQLMRDAEDILHEPDNQDLAELYRLGITHAGTSADPEHQTRYAELFARFKKVYDEADILKVGPFDPTGIIKKREPNSCLTLIDDRIITGLGERHPDASLPFWFDR